jgi:hypothetical protein
LSNIVYRDYVQVPVERVGVLIGKGGSVKSAQTLPTS